VIKGFGNSRPSAFFIADSPQGKDVDTGYALTGYAGNLLKDFLKEQNLNIDDFWRTCLIKEIVPKDIEEAGKCQPLIDKYSSILVEEINDLKPHLLIPLGELGFSYFTGLSGIRKFRGSVLPTQGDFNIQVPNLKVLPILGPYPFINQDYKLRVISRIDFGKIPKYLNDCPIPDNVYNIWVARTSAALRSFFERHYQKTLDSGGYVVFDIETYMQIPICISFCFDGFESVCVPLVDPSIDRDNRVLMLQMVAKALSSPIPKVNQNIKYDWKILERWWFRVVNVIGDTMLASSVLYCEFPKNLGFLTSIYTDLPYFKDEGKDFDPDKGRRDRYYLYNAKDSLSTHQIYGQQVGELVEKGVDGVYKSLINVMPIYRKMEDRGIRIDAKQRDLLLTKYESLYHIQELKCARLLNQAYFNPLSPKQCKWAIYDELGYKKVRGVKTSQDGSPSTDEESLELLAIYGEASRAPSTGPLVLSAIIGARKIHKVIEILELHLHPDERFRCEYNLAGTEMGRTSAGETTDQYIVYEDNKIRVINLGHSLQTIGKHGFMMDGVTYGKDLRTMFVPSPGYRFVECDLSGAEARVDRVLSGCFDMEVFNNPGIHKLTGSWLYDCKPQDIRKNTLVDPGDGTSPVDRYHLSKTFRHAGERNMGPDRALMLTGRPIKECKLMLEKFHKFQPEIKEVYHRDIMRALDEPTHCLVAPNGRRRDFFDRIDKHTYNEGISFLPQAIVSDQTKFHGIGKTFSDASIYGWASLLAEQHDGMLAEVKNGREVEFGLLYKKNIESEPIDFNLCTLKRDYQLVIPCEISVGDNWLEMEDVAG
jgi:uracil-DNA glycosylase